MSENEQLIMAIKMQNELLIKEIVEKKLLLSDLLEQYEELENNVE